MARAPSESLPRLSEALVRALPSGVLVWRLIDAERDDSLSLVFANAAAESLLGMDLAAPRGWPVREVFPGVSSEDVAACANAARGGAVRAADLGPAAALPPGPFSRTMVPLPDRCVAVTFDRVAADEDAAAEVRTLNAFLDSIIENIPAKVFVKNAETLRFERLNRMCEEMLGLPREQLLGKNDFDLFPPEQAEFFHSKDRETLQGRRLVDIPEEPIETPHGLRWLHTKKFPILDQRGQPRYLVGISYDITDRKLAQDVQSQAHRELEARVEERTAALTLVNAELRMEIAERQRAEEALKRSEDELRQSQKIEAIGRLAGGIAHDFNNLLSIILSYSSMIMGALRREDPLRIEAEQIAIAGQRARDLTRQLLAFSRRQLMVPEVLDLGQVVRDLEPMLRRVLGEDIELVIAADRRTALVKADRGQVQQIIMNLVVNARDAMPEGGTLTLGTTDVVLEPSDLLDQLAGPAVELAVIDTGEGMDDETRAHVFEPFFTTKPVGKGTGLGLSTVLGIAQQSGGHVRLESAPGRGAAFRVYLPVTSERPATHASAGASPVRRPAPLPRRGAETILLVEDEGQLRVLARDILRRAGYEVLDAPNAAEAVRLSELHQGAIHLLLTDVVMPHVGGRELARRLAIGRPRMRVLYMSGYTSDTLEDDAAFLPKPITPELLLEKVRQVLG